MGEVTDVSEKREKSIKERLSGFLLDINSIKMITKVAYKEIDTLSKMISIIDYENENRKDLHIKQKNILGKIIETNLILRTSLQGWRSEQIVKIISGINEEDIAVKNTGIFSGILGGRK